MENNRPDQSLFLDILKTLERLNAPYMIVGAFAATVYGLTRVTYDIDLLVDLNEGHIQALAEAYTPPRYYADPEMIRNSIKMGILFNIVDTSRGEKADLIPVNISRTAAFQRRVRQRVEIPDEEPFEVWCARVEDVILGKLMAWEEGRSRKHETDIYEILVFYYMGADSETPMDESTIEAQAANISQDALKLWEDVKDAAQREAKRGYQ